MASSSNDFVSVPPFSSNVPKTAKGIQEIEAILDSNKKALLQLKIKRDEYQKKIKELDTQLKSMIEESKKSNNPDKEKLKVEAIKLLKSKKNLEHNLNTINKNIALLLNIRKAINKQLPPKLEGGGGFLSKPNTEYNELDVELDVLLEISKLLIDLSTLTINIINKEDELEGSGQNNNRKSTLKEEIEKLKKEKAQLSAKIEFINIESLPEIIDTNAELETEAKLETELETELNELLEEKATQNGGKSDNNKNNKNKLDKSKLLKQIGNTIYPQEEYSGKLYLEDNMLYYYDLNYNGVLTDKIPIITILKLEKLLKEHTKTKKEYTKTKKEHTKTKKTKSKINKNIKTQKRK